MTKRCCTCKIDLPLSSFKSNKTRSDGLQGQCIECHKQYRRQHYLDNRSKYIKKARKRNDIFRDWWKEFKKGFKCSECPEDHPAYIQFHHENDDKDRGVSVLVGIGSKKRVLEEIAKCKPLCANCHCKEHDRLRRP